jgi:hypothetical protein
MLFVVPVMPGLGSLIAAFVAPFAAPALLSWDEAAHGKADQGDGGGEKDQTGFHGDLLDVLAVS